MKYCPTSTVFRNPASVQILISRSCCESLSTRSWYFCNRSPCTGSLVEGMCVFITLGTNNGSDCPASTCLSVLTWQDLYSSHKSETAPKILSWFTEMIVRKTVSIVSPSAQECVDNFPTSCASEHTSREWTRGSENWVSAFYELWSSSIQRLCPIFLLVFVSGIPLCIWPKSEKWPTSGNLCARPWNCSGSPILFMNFWTSRTSSNEVNPVKIFYSNSIDSPSIVSKVLYCRESLNQPNCSSQTVFDAWFWFTCPRDNTKSENT